MRIKNFIISILFIVFSCSPAGVDFIPEPVVIEPIQLETGTGTGHPFGRGSSFSVLASQWVRRHISRTVFLCPKQGSTVFRYSVKLYRETDNQGYSHG